jgi:DNA-binding FrmR family transcriptional regulator
VTSDEVQLIQQLIKSEFAQRDQKLSEGNRRFAMIEDRLNIIDGRVGEIERNMNEFHEVASELKDVAHSMAAVKDAWEPVQRIAQLAMSKKMWAFMTAAIIAGNWIADRVPQVVGWFS